MCSNTILSLHAYGEIPKGIDVLRTDFFFFFFFYDSLKKGKKKEYRPQNHKQ